MIGVGGGYRMEKEFDVEIKEVLSRVQRVKAESLDDAINKAMDRWFVDYMYGEALYNKAKTDLNVVVGLCVGHDSLFYKYSEALTTTAVTKDRVLGHNPVAALYTADSYYSKLKKSEEE